MVTIRSDISHSLKRVVIKVGSQTITHPEGGLDAVKMGSISNDIISLLKLGLEVVIVSSGAIQVGKGIVKNQGEDNVPCESIEEQQALSAIGQPYLVEAWRTYLNQEHQVHVAQVLLTHDDMGNRTRSLNASQTLNHLLSLDVVPILNENDSVSFEEITVGDNDQLAAMVAGLVNADLLILLTGPDGVYTSDPSKYPDAEKLSTVQKGKDGHELLLSIETKSKSKAGRGGMQTKIAAAQKLQIAGIPTLITTSEVEKPLLRSLTQIGAGTYFEKSSGENSKKSWLMTTARSSYGIEVDQGAAQALSQGASLLPKGIVKVSGSFKRGDCVYIRCDGRSMGCGLAEYDAYMLNKIIGKHSNEIEEVLGYKISDEAIHRDNMVVGELLA